MAELLQHLRALGARGQPGVFACSGEAETPRPIAISYKTPTKNKDTNDSPTRRYKTITFPPSNNQNIQDLLSVCHPETHGHGNKTVLDASYRLTSTLDASEFTLSFDMSELSILPTIQQFLTPQGEFSEKVGVRASLYKLNVYGPGGFFKSHVDTPRGGDTFGTLVVCLPCEFTGGVLTVRHNNEDERLDWGASGFASANMLRWGAFFSDCEHWIDEVTSGYRITVTYNLHPSFAPDGAILGVSLARYYAIDGSEDIVMLKGVDQVWKEALDYLGLQYKYVLAFKRNEESFERGSSRTQEDEDEAEWDDRESLDDWDGDGDFSLFLRDKLYMINSARVDLENGAFVFERTEKRFFLRSSTRQV
ncbi:hypothetical protein Poli38472_007337 [Pythium oligandrum]|uniref:Fe2OG dioxygenase domain-containing protein n=1 Tax=Pythium oligandrum TaxID=41045 RepID=A0A8K1FGY4_PYTOL|nr:hypothetical protein Poli38472_007337 [Pythium oligandrum]|eukprot:TMW59192.1 hypothetical protein Poli38472_007337 [Pythium oligandrum]